MDDPKPAWLPGTGDIGNREPEYLREEVARLRRERAAEQAAVQRAQFAREAMARDAVAVQARREEEVVRLREAVAALEADLASLRDSRSWRLTRPLRAAVRALTAFRAPEETAHRPPAIPAPVPAADPDGDPAGPAAPGLPPHRVLLAGPEPVDRAARARLDLILSCLDPAAAGQRPWTPDAPADLGEDLRWAVARGFEAAATLLPVLRARSPWARLVLDAGDAGPEGAAAEAALRGCDLTLVAGMGARRDLLAREPLAVVEALHDPVPVLPHAPTSPEPEGGGLVVWTEDSPADPQGAGARIAAAILRDRPQAAVRVLPAPGAEEAMAALAGAAACVVPVADRTLARRLVAAALGQGVPVVTTPDAAADLALRSGGEVLVAETEAGFADRAGWVLADAGLRRSLAVAGHGFATEHLSAAAVRQRARMLLRG